MAKLLIAALLLLSVPAWAEPSVTNNVWMEDMTSPEVRDAISAGYKTAIIPIGGTEQNGPHMILGKHNVIIRYTAQTVAEKLTHTLVAPPIAYVPEGTIAPPSGHMRFAGTISIRPEVFSAMLEDSVRSLKQHGFKVIALMGEHGSTQPLQKEIADRLTSEWKEQNIRVIHVSDYYDEHNGQVEWLKNKGEKEVDIEAHAALSDTSELLSVLPRGVRVKLLDDHSAADMDTLGAGGSSAHVNRTYGIKLLDLKVNAAAAQIVREATANNPEIKQ